MKSFLMLSMMLVSATSGVLSVPESPFQYRYEIMASSRKSVDVVALYKYKEKLIDTYEQYFMPLPKEQLEYCIRENISQFAFEEDARAYYISGTIVVLLGDAKGLTISGELRSSDCDNTVIREKLFIFDLF